MALATEKPGLDWQEEAEFPPQFRMTFNSSHSLETKFIAQGLRRSRILNHSSAVK